MQLRIGAATRFRLCVSIWVEELMLWLNNAKAIYDREEGRDDTASAIVKR